MPSQIVGLIFAAENGATICAACKACSVELAGDPVYDFESLAFEKVREKLPSVIGYQTYVCSACDANLSESVLHQISKNVKYFLEEGFFPDSYFFISDPRQTEGVPDETTVLRQTISKLEQSIKDTEDKIEDQKRMRFYES